MDEAFCTKTFSRHLWKESILSAICNSQQVFYHGTFVKHSIMLIKLHAPLLFMSSPCKAGQQSIVTHHADIPSCCILEAE